MNDFYEFGRKLRDLLRGLLRIEDDGGAAGPPPRAKADRFPRGGVDLIHHDLRVNLDVGAKGKIDETVALSGTMLIERGGPYENEKGLRQVDFRVRSWMATGWSRQLNSDITYVLSEDVEQPMSQIVAEERGLDFPATFQFNVIFDARAGNRVVFRKHHGRPKGHGFFEIPPSGNRATSPTITAFEDTLIVVEHPEAGEIQIKPVDCNDQDSRTLETFEEAYVVA